MGGPDTYLTNFTHALVATVKHYAAYGEYCILISVTCMLNSNSNATE